MNFLSILTGIGVLAIGMIIAAAVYRQGSDRSGSVAWRTDLNAALRESAQIGRPVLVSFVASWDHSCQRMKSEVWTDGRLAMVANTKFIPVLVDVDEQAGTAKRYEIAAIPTLLVIEPGKPAYQRTGFHDIADVLGLLQEHGK